MIKLIRKLAEYSQNCFHFRKASKEIPSKALRGVASKAFDFNAQRIASRKRLIERLRITTIDMTSTDESQVVKRVERRLTINDPLKREI